MRTGDQRPAERSRRQTSKPSMSPRRTSSTIPSYSLPVAIHTASSPEATMSTAKPASTSPRSSSRATFTASSPTSTRTATSGQDVDDLELLHRSLHRFLDDLADSSYVLLVVQDAGLEGRLLLGSY